MREIILDGKELVDIQRTHLVLKELFNFPDYYGKNLDAFWDCITDYAIGCCQEESEKIIWKDFDISKHNLGEYANTLLGLFREASEKYGGFTIKVIP